jgi:FkbM family methyltransferase
MRTLILDGILSVVSGRDGTFLVNCNDIYIGRSIAIYGEHGALESEFLKSLLKPGDHIVEVGANIGAHTVGLAKAVGPQGRVDAFEAQRICFAFLQAQIALNQLYNIHARQLAVGRSSGKLWVPSVNYAEYGNFGGIALSSKPEEKSESVEVVTLDSQIGDRRCDLVKVDVEGMEEDVIRGAKNLINKRRPILYVENDRPERSQSLVALLLGLGYRLWWHIPKLYNPNNHFMTKEDVYQGIASFNMFCCTENHPAASALPEIKSPDETHPLARKSFPAGLPYTIKT